jgi:alpha-beta hydrolase superfamily lysophospholipase
MKSFRTHRSWTAYRAILAEEFGIALTQEPAESFRPVRGHQIRVDEWPASGLARGVLILVHGGGGNGRILAPLAEPMAQQGWKVLAPDLPGYGLTQSARGYAGEYSEWPAVIAEIADNEPGPVVLMGLSMGGLTAVLAGQTSRRVAGVIATTLLDLSNPDIFIRATRWTWLGRLSLFTMAVAPWLFDRIVMPLSWAAPLAAMSGDRRMQDYFQRDPLIGGRWMAARFFRMVHQHRVESWVLDCPLLLAHPGADAWTPTALSLPVFKKIVAEKRFVELSNGSHLPTEQPAYAELLAAVRNFLSTIASDAAAAATSNGAKTVGASLSADQ